MRRLLIIVAIALSAATAQAATTAGGSASFYVSGTVAYTCALGGKPCNSDPHPAGCKLQGATLYVYVSSSKSFIPSDCGPELACTCWNLKPASVVNVYGKMYETGGPA